MSREKWKLLRWRLLLSRPRHSPFLLFPPPVAISIAINIRSYTHSQTRAHGFAYPRTHSHTHPPVLKHNARRRRRLNPRWDGDGKLFPCYIKSFSFFRGVQPPPAPLHPTSSSSGPVCKSIKPILRAANVFLLSEKAFKISSPRVTPWQKWSAL